MQYSVTRITRLEIFVSERLCAKRAGGGSLSGRIVRSGTGVTMAQREGKVGGFHTKLDAQRSFESFCKEWKRLNADDTGRERW